jgi:hypothetical protein
VGDVGYYGILIQSLKIPGSHLLDCKEVQITLQTNNTDDGHNPSSVVMEYHCVCTVPLGVLRQRKIVFVPDFPEHRRKAIDSVGMGLLDKNVLIFDQSFWGDYQQFGIANAADPTLVGGDAVLTVFLLGGNYVRRMSAMAEQEAVQDSLQEAEQEAEQEAVQDSLEKGACQCSGPSRYQSDSMDAISMGLRIVLLCQGMFHCRGVRHSG